MDTSGPRPPRNLEWDPETNSWAPTRLSTPDYQKKYAANIARGAFQTLGSVASPDMTPFAGAGGDPFARPSIQALMGQDDPNSDVNQSMKGRKTIGGRTL